MKRVLNAKPVDGYGKVIHNLKQWKLDHPGELYFDSMLEYQVYFRFKTSGITIVIKPEPILLVQKFSHLELDYPEDVNKELRKKVRAASKFEKARVKREFEKNNKKSMVSSKSLAMTWEVDFLLPEYNLYVEAKGFANEVFPIKYKVAQYLHHLSNYDIVTVYTIKDCEDLIEHLLTIKK